MPVPRRQIEGPWRGRAEETIGQLEQKRVRTPVTIVRQVSQCFLNVGLGHFLRNGLMDATVVLATSLPGPIQSQRQVDRRHRQNALESVILVGFVAVFFPEADQHLLCKGPFLVERRSPGRLPLRQRLTGLLERDSHGVGVVGERDAGETISVFANKDIPR